MASKVYTAKEMREVAAIISRLHIVDRTTCGEYSARIKDKLRSMLRQAADMMEHNESLLNKAGETVVGLMNKMSAQDEEIKKLRTLVKELADNYGGHWPFASLAVDAVKAAQRLYCEFSDRLDKALAMHEKAAEQHEKNYTTQKEVKP